MEAQALFKMFPERKCDISESMETFMGKLQKITKDSNFDPFQENNLFEIQRKNLGRSYKMAGDILLDTKDAIWCLKHEPDSAGQHILYVVKNYKELLNINIPNDILYQFSAEVGQEVVELVFVERLFGTLFFGKKPAFPPTPEELCVTPQAYLAGIADVAGELGKMVEELLLRCEVTKEYQKTIDTRLEIIHRDLADYLSQFEAVYNRVIQNVRRPGYENTFRGIYQKMLKAINNHRERVIEDLYKNGGGMEYLEGVKNLPENFEM